MRLLVLPVLFVLTACRPAPQVLETVPDSWSLLETKLALEWQQAGIQAEGKIFVKDGELMLEAGQPMTGASFPRWLELGLPETNYAIRYEAMRVEGTDIFGMCTFPVGSHQAHATFVIGGWGGAVTGISSLDFLDASENGTRSEHRFETGRWYQVRIEVRPEDLRVWIDQRPVVNTSIRGRKVSLRPGDVDHCLPFGFATWNTKGKVRQVVVERLRQ